ncbi:MAG: hypothetical protein NTW21_03600 [Verrucomicrobia bacterium]|nr:hypothetical protein [Verrucomicrobiota bacterium]
MNTIQQTLIQHAATIKPVVRHYDGNLLCEELAFDLTESATLSCCEADWSCQTKLVPASGGEGRFDLECTFRLTRGTAESAGIGVAIGFADWSPDNYVLLPSAVYDSNNFAIWDIKYPPFWSEPSQFRADMPTTATPVPRLSADSTRLEQTTGDTAAPCMGFHSAARQQGFLLLTTQGTRFGNSGLTVETNADRSRARFLVTAPCVREFRQDPCKAVPSDDRAINWQAGDCVTLRLSLWFFSAPRLQALFDRFCEIRKAPLNPSVPTHELPFSAAWQILDAKYNRDNWDEALGYYRLAPNADTTFEVSDNPLCFLWQLGWVGGGIATLPLSFQGSALSQQRAWRNLEMLFERTAAPSGFFYGIGDGENFYGDGIDGPHPHHLHMVRKSADALLLAFKHFDLFRKQEREIPPLWITNTHRLADAFARLWEQAGQLGQFVDVETGELLIGGSAAGAIAPAGLARASLFFDEPRYLSIAVAAARKYYQDFVLRGLTTGGPGEILSAPDSESAFAMLESFVTLLEITGDHGWLQPARDLLRQCATWVVSYDYVFPADSALGKSQARTTGAVWANVQNKSACPGICTLSGDSLLRLWRASGDTLALELLRDIAHGLPQYLSREDRLLGKPMHPGWMCERVNLSDWEGVQGIGGNLFGSCWAEVSLMLTTIEIPGLYVQPDTGMFQVFDHVLAEAIGHHDNSLTLKLTNPTRFDAEVKVLCEPSTACNQPLALNALLGTRTVCIPAGGSVIEAFRTNETAAPEIPGKDHTIDVLVAS